MSQVRGATGYADGGTRFCELRESIAFRNVHDCLLHGHPEPGAPVLDIGAGGGSKAAALARPT